MVLAVSIDSALSYLAAFPRYSIWASTLAILRSQLEASPVEFVLFAASDNESCVLQGFPSGGFWATSDPTSFLCQIVELPPRWPAAPVRMFECDTLGVDSASDATIALYMRVSPQSFILPSEDAIARCDLAIPRAHGCALALRSSFLDLLQPQSTLQDAIASLSPELSDFSTWLVTAGIGSLPLQSGAFTLLAPTNAAFASLAASMGITALAFVTDPAFAHMAFYHVASGTFGPLASVSAPPDSAVASDGFLLTFQTSAAASFVYPNAVNASCLNYVNCAVIDESASQVTGNGILYVIDAVLGHGVSGPFPACSVR